MGNQQSSQPPEEPPKDLTPEQIKALRLKRLEETTQKSPPSSPVPPSNPPSSLLPSSLPPLSLQNPSSSLPPPASSLPPIFSPQKKEAEGTKGIAATLIRSPSPKNIKSFLDEKEDLNYKLSEIFSLNLCETKKEEKKNYFNIVTPIRLLDIANMDTYIEEILSSPANEGFFFKSQEEKVDYLFNALEKMDKYFLTTPPPLFLRTRLFNFIISLILTPSIYNINLSPPTLPSSSLPSPPPSLLFPPPSPPPPSSSSLFPSPLSLEERFFRRLLGVEPNLLEEFLRYLSVEFSSEDVEELIEGVFMKILGEVNANGGIDNVKPVVNALCFLDAILKVDYFMNYFIQKSRTFFPSKLTTGLDLQRQNILCSALSISTLPEESKAWELYWKDGGSIGRRREAERMVEVVREKLNEVGIIVFRIFDRVLKSNESNRCRLISFLFQIISLNKDKTKLFSFNSPITSKNGFLLNFLKLLLRLCLPFISDINKIQAKLDKVNVNFFDSKIICQLFQGIEPLNPEKCKEEGGGGIVVEIVDDRGRGAVGGGSGGAEVGVGVGRGVGKEGGVVGVGGAVEVGVGKEEGFNFITQIFFITTYFIHLVQIIYKNYFNFLVKLSDEAKTNQNSQQFALLVSYKFAYDVMIADPFLIENIIKTFAFCSMLSFHLLSFPPPSSSSSPPIFFTPTLSFAKLPLYFAEDMHEFLMILLQSMPEQIKKNETYFLVICHFMLVCMGNKNLITNPHIRAKFLIVLSILGGRKEEGGRREGGIFKHFLTKDAYFQKHLIDCLIEIFIDVEKTGSSNQFYEKFSYRNRFCELMAFILTEIGGGRKEEDEGEENNYRGRLKAFSLGNEEKMLQFYNLFLNDIIYLLDESLMKLKEIKIYEDSESSMNTLSFQERLEKKQNYEQTKKILKTFLDFLNAYYENISLMSSFVSDVLISEALREKIVFNLNYTIEALNGKNALELKVKNMKRLNFDPKFILKCIIQLYLNLSHEPVFLETIVKDERSFNPLTFEKTKNILIKNQLIDDDDIYAFDRLLNKLNQLLASQQATDELLRSPSLPDRFLDPIMSEIMKDPVLLPDSKVVVDRMTIIKHLLSDPTDPFNRKPLKKENLVEMPELKKEIEEWIGKMMGKGKKKGG